MNTGWIKLHRSILKWEWWDDRNTRDLFIYLLLAANHEDAYWHGIPIPRGTLVTGRKKLARGAGISEQSVRTSLNKLESTQNLTITSTNHYSIITICNYNLYQDYIAINNQPSNQQLTNNQPTTNQQLTTNKNNKNERMEEGEEDYLSSLSSSAYAQIVKNESGNSGSHGDNYRPLESLFDELRQQYSSETPMADAIRMKIYREYGTVLSPEQLGQYFDEYHESLVAGGITYDNLINYRIHFRNWMVRKFELQKSNNNDNRNTNPERPSQIADAAQFVDRL